MTVQPPRARTSRQRVISHLRPQDAGPESASTRTEPDGGRTVVATITARTPGRALAALAAAGADPGFEARRLGLPEDLDPDFAWRVPIDAAEALFARGIARCGPDFPLEARTVRTEDNRSLVNLYARTRPTVRAAIRETEVLFGLVTDAYTIRLEEQPGGGWLTWHGPPRPAIWWFDAADFTANLGGVVGAGRRRVSAVRAPFPAPPSAKAVFGCDVQVHPVFGIRVDDEVLDLPLPPVDAAIRAFVEREIGRMASEPPGPGPVAALWSLGPTATLARLAEVLGCSERTVHRRLAEAGTSFRAELDAVRAHYASNAPPARSTDELAALLGYSDARAFRRARHRWRRG